MPGVAGFTDLVRDIDPSVVQTYASALTDPDDLALLEQVTGDVTGEGWRTDPAAMAAHFNGAPLDSSWRTPPHVRYLSQKFRQLVTGESRRQIWNLPGRYGKSRIGSQWGPAWCFDRTEGRARLILISYGDDLSDENAYAVRQILRAHSELRCELRADRQRIDRFVTDAGGGLLSAGINSAVTGFGAGGGGGIVIDDPFKNWQEAHSEARRNHVYNQYRGTLRNRLDDDEAFILVIHHRVHEDDLTQRLVNEMLQADEYGDVWDVTVLPALAAEGDVLGRAPGEPLDPERFPFAAVRNRMAGMGSYLASALELQRPTPEEGNDIKRAWFRVDALAPAEFDDCLSAWDTKLKDKESGDFVVGQVWGRTGSDFWCLAEFRGQWNQATMRSALALVCVRFPNVLRHLVEFAGYGPEVIEQLTAGSGEGYELDEAIAGELGMTEEEREKVQQLLRSGIPGIQGRTPKGDKRVRARAVTPLIEARNCHLPENAGFVPGFLDEVAAFPNGTHDDRVDAMSLALKELWNTDAELVEPELLLETRVPGVLPRFR